MNQKWPRHVALRKRVLDELIIDVWTATNEHNENAANQKHEQNINHDTLDWTRTNNKTHCEDTVAPATISLKWRRREMNHIWFGLSALRQKVLDELIMDVWTETIQHQENEERQKHEQTVILISNSGWKPQCESESRMETKQVALPHHFTKKTANSNAQTPHATHSGQPCKMIQTSQHPHRRRNMRFLMCPNMTWNTVPFGGHADSHTIQLTAPPSQHLIEQTRTTTGRHSVALATPTLRRLHREKKQRGSLHVTLRQRSARWTHHRRLQWRNTLANKQAKRTRSTNRKYDIETSFWSKTLREQPPCKNLSIPTVSPLNLPDYSTQQFKHTRANNLNFTNRAPTTNNSNTHRKPSKDYELQLLEC